GQEASEFEPPDDQKYNIPPPFDFSEFDFKNFGQEEKTTFTSSEADELYAAIETGDAKKVEECIKEYKKNNINKLYLDLMHKYKGYEECDPLSFALKFCQFNEEILIKLFFWQREAEKQLEICLSELADPSLSNKKDHIKKICFCV